MQMSKKLLMVMTTVAFGLTGCATSGPVYNRFPSSVSNAEVKDFLIKYPNFTRTPYIADTVFYTNIAAYKGKANVPIDYAKGKNYVTKILQDICALNSNYALDTETISYEYYDGIDVGGAGVGDIVLNPIQAANSRSVKITANAKCSDGSEDGVLEALRNDKNDLFKQEVGGYNIIERLPALVTVRMGVFSINKKGKVRQIDDNQLPELKLKAAWKTTKLFKEVKNVSEIDQQVVDTDNHGYVYSKMNLKAIKEKIGSNEGTLTLTVDGKDYPLAYPNFKARDFTYPKIVYWGKDITLPDTERALDVFPVVRLNVDLGILDIRVFVKVEK